MGLRLTCVGLGLFPICISFAVFYPIAQLRSRGGGQGLGGDGLGWGPQLQTQALPQGPFLTQAPGV